MFAFNTLGALFNCDIVEADHRIAALVKIESDPRGLGIKIATAQNIVKKWRLDQRNTGKEAM